MRDHVKILGILNIIMGCLGALLGLVVLLVFGGLAGITAGWTGDADAARAAPILAIIGFFIAIFVLVLALPCIIGGWGLLKFKPWARVLMIVISALHLFHIPLGTALGVYGLWVLLHRDTERLFQTGGQGYLPAHPYPAPPSYPPSTPPSV